MPIIRTITEEAFQVQSRVWFVMFREPRWSEFNSRYRSRYAFTNEYDKESAFERAKARIEKLKKDDHPGDRNEYRIVKITKTTVVEEVFE